MTTVIYEPATQGEDLAYGHKQYRGRIQPHPELKVFLDDQGRVVASHADLALILLDKPVEEELHPIKLAESEVELNESIVMVGYGEDETDSGAHGGRRFSRSRAAKLPKPEGGRVLLEQPKQPTDVDDSGGPCLRETSQGPALVGISSRRLGKDPSFTSTYPYRAWLRAELQPAGKADSGTSP